METQHQLQRIRKAVRSRLGQAIHPRRLRGQQLRVLGILSGGYEQPLGPPPQVLRRALYRQQRGLKEILLVLIPPVVKRLQDLLMQSPQAQSQQLGVVGREVVGMGAEIPGPDPSQVLLVDLEQCAVAGSFRYISPQVSDPHEQFARHADVVALFQNRSKSLGPPEGHRLAFGGAERFRPPMRGARNLGLFVVFPQRRSEIVM